MQCAILIIFCYFCQKYGFFMKLRVLPALAMAASLLFSCDFFTDGPENGGEEIVDVFSITPESVTVPAEGGEFEFTVVSTKLEYEITIVNDWITRLSRSGDRMKGETFRFNASANEGESARSGVVSVCTNDGVCVPVMVSQAAKASSGEEESKPFVHNNIGFRFTGTWCGWCPYMDEVFHTIAADESMRFNYVAFHNSDAMAIADGSKLETIYKVTGFPTGVLNGLKNIDNYADISYTVARLKDAISQFEGAFTCDAGIGVGSELDINLLSIKATVKAVPGDYMLSAFLLESGIVEPQAYYYYDDGGTTISKTLSDFLHDNVARKTLSKSPSGDAFTATEEETVFEWEVILNSAWSKENLSVAVVVLRPYGADSANKADSTFPDNFVVNSVIVPVGTTKEIEYAE